jgi:hypothetical protein
LSQTPPYQTRGGTSFVLDNSVLCGWFLASQASDDGDAIAHQLSQVDAHAPCPPPERKVTTSLRPDRRQLKHRLGVGLGGTPSMIRWA